VTIVPYVSIRRLRAAHLRSLPPPGIWRWFVVLDTPETDSTRAPTGRLPKLS